MLSSTYTQHGNENFNYLCNGKCYKTSFTLSLVYIFNYMLSKALCTYSTLIYLEAYFTVGLKRVASVKSGSIEKTMHNLQKAVIKLQE